MLVVIFFIVILLVIFLIILLLPLLLFLVLLPLLPVIQFFLLVRVVEVEGDLYLLVVNPEVVLGQLGAVWEGKILALVLLAHVMLGLVV